jgi:hypothetical protein
MVASFSFKKQYFIDLNNGFPLSKNSQKSPKMEYIKFTLSKKESAFTFTKIESLFKHLNVIFILNFSQCIPFNTEQEPKGEFDIGG